MPKFTKPANKDLIKLMYKKKFFIISAITISVFLCFGVGAVFAQAPPGPPGGSLSQSGGVQLRDPLGADSFQAVAASIIGFLFTIAAPLVGIFVLVGGFQMITAGGNPEQFSKGKKTILYAAVGFVVVLLSGSVVSLLRNVFGG